MLTCGTLELFMITWNTLFFEKMLKCGVQLNIMITWNTLFKNNAYMWDQIWFMTPLTWQKCLHVAPWKILWRLGTLYFRKNAYMWDQTKFYDDLEHSIFKIMLTCGTKVGLWCHCGAYGVTKQSWNSERSATVATIMTKVFLSLILLGSEILWRDQPGTS
jgi:hypothetical protein